MQNILNISKIKKKMCRFAPLEDENRILTHFMTLAAYGTPRQNRDKFIQLVTEYNYKYDMSSPGSNTFLRQLNKVLSAHVLLSGAGHFRFQTTVSVQR